MKNLGRILLLVGGLVLALLVGVLIGRGQRVEPPAAGNAQAVQITTAPPPALPTVTPLPAPPPVQALQPAAVPKISPDLQVQEDAAAVGMTTRDDGDVGLSGDASQPKSAASGGGDPTHAQPVG